jgi:hypothetical protein
MKKFIIERNMPGAGNLSPPSENFCEVINQLGKPYHWIQSFIAEDKIYSIHIAKNEEAIREHARLGKLPENAVREVKAIIDPLDSNPLQEIYISRFKLDALPYKRYHQLIKI